MRTQFAFGKSGIQVSVPDSYRTQVVRTHAAAVLPDVTAALSAALDAPIGC